MLVGLLMGCMGGVFALVFTISNLKINRLRNTYIKPYKWLSVAEPCLIAAIVSSLAFALTRSGGCIPIPFDTPYIDCAAASNATRAYWPVPNGADAREKTGDCALRDEWYSQYNCNDGEYDPLASLFQVPALSLHK